MKKHNLSKLIALTMTCTLLAAPFTAFGAPTESDTPGTSISANGTGSVEGNVDKEVYKVVLPTQSDVDTASTFDFILDPQDLINETSGAAHSGITAVSGNQLYFTKGTELNGTSDTLTVLNKSSVDVDITVEATVSALTDGTNNSAYEISLADSDTFEANDTSTSIYLGLNVDDDDAVALTAANGASVTKTLAGAPDQYEITHDGSEYKYDLKTSATDADFEKLEFSLSGACNTNADWADAVAAVPTVNVVWGFDKAATGPKVTLSSTGLITVSGLTAEQNYKAGIFKGVNIATEFKFFAKGSGTYDVDNWSATEGGSFTYQLADAYVNAYSGDTVTVTVTLTDGSTITTTTTL